MAIAYGTPTDLPELLGRVEARLADRTAVHATLVFATLAADEELVRKPPGDRFVTLRLGRFVPVQAHFAGGALPTFAGTLLVQLWQRDDTAQDLRAGGGLAALLAVWLKAFDALENFTPVRESDPTQGLTIEPVRAADPGFEVPARVPPKWGRLDSSWQLRFVHRRP